MIQLPSLMKLSKKAEYALRSMVEIARVSGDRSVPISELAADGKIPAKFLEQILLSLKRSGLLTSKRGVGGGYQLARRSSEITLGEIIGIMDGRPKFVPEASELAGSGLALVMGELQDQVDAALDGTSVADVIDREAKEGGAMVFDI